MNSGKRFENNFKKSVPNVPEVFLFRLRDTASSYYGGNENLRFSGHNPCDFMLFYNGKLFLLELKSIKGKSLPLGCIRETQIEELLEYSKKINVLPKLVVYFSDLGECYSLDIDFLYNFEENYKRKSIPIEFFKENGQNIEVEQKKVNFSLNIVDWLNRN